MTFSLFKHSHAKDFFSEMPDLVNDVQKDNHTEM